MIELLSLVGPPGLFAGLVAVAVTVVIERLGGGLGGAVGTLPTTIVPAALGMAAASDPEAFVRAINTAPAGILVNAFFLYLWRVVPAWLPVSRLWAKLALMVSISLTAWGLAAAAAVAGIARYLASGASPLLLGRLTTATVGLVGLLACAKRVPTPRGRNRVGPWTLAGRGALAAVAVGFSAWLAASRIELAAGMAAVFPAIFLTTMVSLWLSQGEAVPAGAVGPMMLGATSVAVFCNVVSLSLPALGWLAGTVVAWVFAAVTVTLPVSLWLAGRDRASIVR